MATEEKETERERDAELEMMGRFARQLKRLDLAAQKRVVEYLAARVERRAGEQLSFPDEPVAEQGVGGLEKPNGSVAGDGSKPAPGKSVAPF